MVKLLPATWLFLKCIEAGSSLWVIFQLGCDLAKCPAGFPGSLSAGQFCHIRTAYLQGCSAVKHRLCAFQGEHTRGSCQGILFQRSGCDPQCDGGDMAQQSHIVAEDTSKLGKAKKLLGEDRSCKNAFWQDIPPNTNIPSSSLPVWTKIFNKT